MTKKKTTAFLQSSGELAGARTALAVTEGVPLVALARCGKHSRGNPANIASNEVVPQNSDVTTKKDDRISAVVW